MTHFKIAEVHMKEVNDVASQHKFGDGAIEKEDDGMTRHLQKLVNEIATNKSGNEMMEQQ